MLRKKLPASVITLISTLLLQVLFRFFCIPFFVLSWKNIAAVASPFMIFMWSLTFIAIFAAIAAPKARRPKKAASAEDKDAKDSKVEAASPDLKKTQ